MILPATYFSGLLLMILALVCAGTWSSLFKAAHPYRYELYNFDLSLGIVILAVAAALTLGSLKSNELSVEDNILISSYRLMAWAFAAGLVFNLGNAVLLAAISAGGIAISVPVSLGVALIVDTTLDFIANPRANALLLFGGAAVVLAAIVVFILAYFRHRRAAAIASKKAAPQIDPRAREVRGAAKRSKAVAPSAVAVIALISGVLLAFPPRLLSMARSSEVGLAPYGLMLFFSAGAFLSALLCSPFLLTFPVGGAPAQLRDYFRGSLKAHILGILGGMLLCGGILAASLVIDSPAYGALGSSAYMALLQAAPLLAVLWGALVWKELRSPGESSSVAGLLWSGFLLYAVGVGLIAIASASAAR